MSDDIEALTVTSDELKDRAKVAFVEGKANRSAIKLLEEIGLSKKDKVWAMGLIKAGYEAGFHCGWHENQLYTIANQQQQLQEERDRHDSELKKLEAKALRRKRFPLSVDKILITCGTVLATASVIKLLTGD